MLCGHLDRGWAAGTPRVVLAERIEYSTGFDPRLFSTRDDPLAALRADAWPARPFDWALRGLLRYGPCLRAASSAGRAPGSQSAAGSGPNFPPFRRLDRSTVVACRHLGHFWFTRRDESG